MRIKYTDMTGRNHTAEKIEMLKGQKKEKRSIWNAILTTLYYSIKKGK